MSTITNAILPPAPQESQALQRVQSDPLAASHWYSADQVAQRVQLVQQVYRSVMQKDTHYGVVPGCGNKKTLLKAGSEQLLMTFRLAVEPKVEDLSTDDCARYRVTTRITHAPTGMFLGCGIGEASSDELKYKWRAAVCDEEFEATPADRRRSKWAKGQTGAYTVKQVRMEVADVANTVLKMAKKRSQIDATLTVTAASDIFTQDLEDTEFPITGAEAMSSEYDQRPQPVQMPQRRSAPPQQTAPPPQTPAPQPTQHQEPPLQPRTYSEPPKQEPPQHAAPTGPVITEPQAKRLFAIAMGSGMTKTELNSYLLNTFGISKSTEMLKSDYEAACAHVSGGK